MQSLAKPSSTQLLGILLVTLTVILWVATNNFLQLILTSPLISFHQPFLLTYISLSLMSIHAAVHFGRVFFQQRRVLGHRSSASYTELVTTPSSTPPAAAQTSYNGIGNSQSTNDDSVKVQKILVQPAARNSDAELLSHGSPASTANRQLYLSCLLLALLWFSMNYCDNLSLMNTSVTSTTAISATSSIFVLLIQAVQQRQAPRRNDMLGVLLAEAGTMVLIYSDSNSGVTSDISWSATVFGDLLAVASAVLYALYITYLHALQHRLIGIAGNLTPASQPTSSDNNSGQATPAYNATRSQLSWSMQKDSSADNLSSAAASRDSTDEQEEEMSISNGTASHDVTNGRVSAGHGEQQVTTQLLMGLMGIAGFFVIWPVGVLLHVTALEDVQLAAIVQSKVVIGSLMVHGLIGTVLSDYIWALSLQYMQSPLISSYAILLTIPLSMLVDIIVGRATLQISYIVGCVCIAAGLVVSTV